jgi:hypothetical protein
LFMSSTKPSFLICVSLNKNTVGVCLPPDIFRIFLRSSYHSVLP